MLFELNQFSQFLYPILVTPKYARSTFERFFNFKIQNVSHSKILLFEILTPILILHNKNAGK